MHNQISPFSSCKGPEDVRASFGAKLKYVAGAYDDPKAFALLDSEITKDEEKYTKGKLIIIIRDNLAHRLFYFAIPPSIFVQVSRAVQGSSMAKVYLKAIANLRRKGGLE